MVSVVIPTYNRGAYLKETSHRILTYLEMKYPEFEVIYVDDGSKDDTAQVLKVVSADCPKVKGVVLKENVGQQNATLAGIRLSKYPTVITMDDDLRYGLEGIEGLINYMERGYDIVYGVMPLGDRHHIRNNGTWLKEGIFHWVFGKPAEIELTSFRVMGPKVLAFVKNDTTRRVYISARVLQCTKNIGNVEVHGDQSLGLTTNYTLKRLVKVLVQLVFYYSKLGQLVDRNAGKKQYEIREIYN